MKKIICLLMSILCVVSMIVPAFSDELPNLEASKIFGYYFNKNISIILLPNGEYLDPQSNESGKYFAQGDRNEFLLETDGSIVYFCRQTNKEGDYFALYEDCLGTQDKIEYKEGKHVKSGDYIFDNDYEVIEKMPLSEFYGVYDSSSIRSEKFEGDGYSSPESVWTAFSEGLRDQNLNKMLSTFAIETYARNFDLAAWISRIYSYNPSQDMLPDNNDLNVNLNTYARLNDITTSIRFLTMTLTKSPVYNENGGKPVLLGKDDSSEILVQELFPYTMDDFEIEVGEVIDLQSLDKSVAETYYREQTQNSMQKSIKEINGDDRVSIAGQLSVNGEEYLLFMDVVQYGDNWYVLELGGYASYIIGLATYQGGLISLSELLEEYLN